METKSGDRYNTSNTSNTVCKAHIFRGRRVHIGHINLSQSFNGAGEHFVNLIESLQQHAIQQHVLVRNVALAKRLDLVEGIVVGPTVRTPITAYCLMPRVDLVHIHNESCSSAGLLLTLTRSVPFVLTRHEETEQSLNPIKQAVRNRASGFVDDDQVTAVEHLLIYRQAVDSLRVPTMLLCALR